VQSGIHDKFVAAVSEAVSQLKQGHAFEEGVSQGPLINKMAIDKVGRATHTHTVLNRFVFP